MYLQTPIYQSDCHFYMVHPPQLWEVSASFVMPQSFSWGNGFHVRDLAPIRLASYQDTEPHNEALFPGKLPYQITSAASYSLLKPQTNPEP